MLMGRALLAVCCVVASVLGACEDAPTVVLGKHLGGGASAAGTSGSVVVPNESELVHAHGCDSAEPVCGADGKTYHNHCRAEEAGVRIVARERCH
jgi:hypothetical protein